MRLKSKFSFSVAVLIAIIAFVTALVVINLFARGKDDPEIFRSTPVLISAIPTWLWLVFVELRGKVVKVELQEEQLLVSKFAGLAPKTIYKYSVFEGFQITNVPEMRGNFPYQYLCLLQKGKRVVKISERYHDNYEGLKNYIAKKIPDLGTKRYVFLQNFREMFD